VIDAASNRNRWMLPDAFNWASVVAWPTWVRFCVLCGAALSVQLIMAPLWLDAVADQWGDHHRGAGQVDQRLSPLEHDGSMLEAVAEFQQWREGLLTAATSQEDLVLDLRMQAEQRGLRVVDAPQLTLQPGVRAEQSWTIEGRFSAGMQWILSTTLLEPQLQLSSLNVVFKAHNTDMQLAVLWVPVTTSAMPSAPLTMEPVQQQVERWQKLLPLWKSADSWPDFEGVDVVRAEAIPSKTWPSTWPENWKHGRRDLLTEVALEDMQWRGALVGDQGRAALVEAGGLVWMVREGDVMGRERYRLVGITTNHMMLQRLQPAVDGQMTVQSWTLGLFHDRVRP
jgi:hypothetical protein